MSLLSAGQVDAMRRVAVQALPDLATIQRRTRTSDGGGGSTEQWADVATVAARITPVGGGEVGTVSGTSTIGGRVIATTTHIVTLPAGTDVLAADQLVVDGTTYEVTLVRKHGEWEITRRVEVREVA